MKSYHFDFGNSNSGPIGYCASIVAESPEAAVERLKKMLPDEVAADDCWDTDEEEREPYEYIRVYLNADAITVNDINFEEELEEESAAAASERG